MQPCCRYRVDRVPVPLLQLLPRSRCARSSTLCPPNPFCLPNLPQLSLSLLHLILLYPDTLLPFSTLNLAQFHRSFLLPTADACRFPPSIFSTLSTLSFWRIQIFLSTVSPPSSFPNPSLWVSLSFIRRPRLRCPSSAWWLWESPIPSSSARDLTTAQSTSFWWSQTFGCIFRCGGNTRGVFPPSSTLASCSAPMRTSESSMGRSSWLRRGNMIP